MATVPSVSRALGVLECLAEADHGASLAELARQLRIAKSTLHQILTTLVTHGYVERFGEPVRYRLGSRVVGLAGAYLRRTDVVRDFYVVAQDVVQRCGETVQLAQLVGSEVLYLAKQDGTQPVRLVSDVGKRLPAHCPALGKAMLSVLPDRVVREWLSRQALVPMTPKTITSLDKLLEELSVTRERGYALDLEETAIGLVCVGAPVLSANGGLYAMSISVPVQRASPQRIEELGQLVRSAAERLSNGSLDYRPWRPTSVQHEDGRPPRRGPPLAQLAGGGTGAG